MFQNSRSNQKQQGRPFSISEYVDAGCPQIKLADGRVDPVGVMLVRETRGYMCNGCPQFNSDCKAYAKLPGIASIAKANNGVVPTETVREEAVRRNISISQVRRERNGG